MFDDLSFWSKFTDKEEIIKIIKNNFYGFCKLSASLGLIYEDKTQRFRDMSNGQLLTIEQIADLFVIFNKKIDSLKTQYFEGPYIVTSLN